MYLPKSNLHIITLHKSLFVILLTHIITQKIEETSLITHPIFQAHNHPKSFLWDISPLLPPSYPFFDKASSKVSVGSNSPFPGFWKEWKITAGPLKIEKNICKRRWTELANLPVLFLFFAIGFWGTGYYSCGPAKIIFMICAMILESDFFFTHASCFFGSSIIAINSTFFTDTAGHPHPIIPYRGWDHHLPCDLPDAGKFEVTGARIQKKTTSSEDHRLTLREGMVIS